MSWHDLRLIRNKLTSAQGIELVIKFFVGTELGVANFLQRHFDWYANSLWYEEIPNARDPSKTKFFLGGRDAIVNAHVRDRSCRKPQRTAQLRSVFYSG